MTAADVREIVKRAMGSEWSRTNAHACDFKRCLVEPYMREFEDCGGPGAAGTVRLWVVLEENPEECDGYQIVFEEQSGEFGLACPGLHGPIYLGRYGSFLRTFDAM